MGQADKPPQALPHDIRAEMGVLGSMLLSPEAVFLARERLEPGSFYRLAHQQIFSAIVELTELMEAVPTSTNAEYYVEIVRENAVRRELMSTAEHILASAQDPARGVDEVLDDAERQMLAVRHMKDTAHQRDISDVLLALMERLEKLHQNPGQLTGLPSGFADLDAITNGFQPGELIVVAARPSVGKTSLALNILEHLCIQERRPAVLYSLEMRAEQIVSNLLCIHNELGTLEFRRGTLREEEWRRVEESVDRMAEAPLYIDDSAALRIGDLRARARRMRHQQGVELVVVDYLQLVRPGRSRDNRAVEVAEISAGLKALARELEVPVLAVAQLNRAVELREQRRPRMSDLRESGAIEQDADVIILLHRTDEPDAGDPAPQAFELPRAGAAEVPGSPTELIVAKQRSGPTAVCHLVFWKRYLKFKPGIPQRGQISA